MTRHGHEIFREKPKDDVVGPRPLLTTRVTAVPLPTTLPTFGR